MRNDYTHITFVIDRSGSMLGTRVGSAVAYAATGKGTRSAYSGISQKLACVRGATLQGDLDAEFDLEVDAGK